MNLLVHGKVVVEHPRFASSIRTRQVADATGRKTATGVDIELHDPTGTAQLKWVGYIFGAVKQLIFGSFIDLVDHSAPLAA
jgi:hypothetical protein